MTSLILCFSAPALQFEVGNPLPNVAMITAEKADSDWYQEAFSEGKIVQKMERDKWETGSILLFVYCVISLLFLFRFIRNLQQIFYRIKHNKSIELSGLRTVLVEEKTTPHSFFQFVFIDKKAFDQGKISEAVLHHELVHSRQFHSVDIVLLELLTCFFWFNPFLWLFKKAMVENHEFLADQAVINHGTDINAYAKELIFLGKNNYNIPITSGFNFSLTKNRIMMLHKKNSSKTFVGVKIGVVLTVFALMIISFSCSSETSYRSDPFVVVVDASHGGSDSGFSIEKTINLQVAQKLANLAKDGAVKIVLTRKTDKFIPLSRRVVITKEQNADLFLSMHCNGSKDKTKQGVVAYIARDGVSEKLSRKYSEIFVSNYLEEITEKGEIGTLGFLVLRKAEIPAVMLELGYLSNKNEAQKLQNADFQQQIAENIYESLLEIREL